MIDPAGYVHGGTQKERYEESDVVRWPCPQCGGQSGRVLKTERGVLDVMVCSGCELIRVNPRLAQPDEIYCGDASIYEEEYRPIVEGGQPHHRDPNYLHDLALIEKHKPQGRFLDIGCGTGSFLRLARGRGWTLQAVEPSPQLGALARRWWGLDVLEGFLEQVDLPDAHFDVVSMTDVFEHIVNPREVLASVRRILKPDGVLFVKVPNARYNLLKYKTRKALGREADDFDAYEHVLHYTDATLGRMLEACEFSVVEMTVEPPVQLPTWHHHVGHYYQNASPFSMDWQVKSARALMFQGSKLERALTRQIGYLAPNLGCIARPA